MRLLLSLPFVALLATPANAIEIRAGQAGFSSGQAGIVVTFTKAMPSSSYAVVVQPTDTGGYSSTSACTYFNVLKKTTAKFEVQHKRCDNNVPVALDFNVTLNWIALSHVD